MVFSGVTLGVMLFQKGENITIFEKESKCGGLLHSIKRDGFTFDIGGSHILFSRNEKLLKYLLDILNNNYKMNTRNTKILFKNKYVRYPRKWII